MMFCEQRQMSELLSVLNEDHDPLVWIHTCVILGDTCNKIRSARNELAQHGLLSCLAKVLNRSIASFASVSEDKLCVYEELVRFIVVEMMEYFSRGSALCIRKFLAYDVLCAVLSTVDYQTPALYDSAVSGMM